jgi:chorismate mutase/prephenate dehydratase
MSEPDLSAFRKEIDAIDAELHALLVRRAEVSEKVRATKTDDSLKLRPGREANILRALVARHTGTFPKPQLIRIWREILSASLAMQGPFSVAVYATETAHSFWDLARDHFGVGIVSWKFGTTRRVVETVVSGQCTVGILPEPDPQDSDPWSQYLLSRANAANDGKPIRVIAKLPFARLTAPYGATEAMIVARAEPEQSGRDRAYLAIDLSADYSTDMLLTEVADCGFTGALLRSKWQDPQDRKRWVQLVEVEGFVAADDKRLAEASRIFDRNFNEIIVVGGFAEPLVLDEAVRPAQSARARAR